MLKWKNQALKGESAAFSLPHQIERGFCTKKLLQSVSKESRTLAGTEVFSAVWQLLKDSAQSRGSKTDDWRKLFMAEVTVAISLGILLYPKMETTLGIYGIFDARGQKEDISEGNWL